MVIYRHMTSVHHTNREVMQFYVDQLDVHFKCFVKSIIFDRIGGVMISVQGVRYLVCSSSTVGLNQRLSKLYVLLFL